MHAKLLLLIGTLTLAGCGLRSLNNDRIVPIGSGSVTTPADLRVILRTEWRDKDGTVQTITCAEPSPDIARLVSESSSGQFNVGGSLAGGAAADFGYGYGRGRAEGMAQLTDRLATIQMLRDAMYRACEAYANRAIDRTAYALIVAHSERLMMSLLFGELISGRKPQPPLALGASSAAESNFERERAALSATLGTLTGKLEDLGSKLAPQLARQAGKKLQAGELLPRDLPLLSGETRRMAEELLRTREQLSDVQQQALGMAGLPASVPNLGLPRLDTGKNKGRSAAGSAIQAPAAAARSSENAQVEIERTWAMLQFVQLIGDPGHPMDGMQVACLSVLGESPEKTTEALRALCGEVMQKVVRIKTASACTKIQQARQKAQLPPKPTDDCP